MVAALPSVWGHGWVTSPVSKNELAFHHWVSGIPDKGFHYEPQSANYGNAGGQPIGFDGGASCGAEDPIYTQGLATWQKFYTESGVAVPRFFPGQDVTFNATLTIDHGGQAFVAISCDRTISENTTWTFLERAQSDRGEHFMPSTPTAFAWAPLEYHVKYNDHMSMSFHVPEDFSCDTGYGVARWLWKTSNSCNDVTGKIGRASPPFKLDEYKAVVHAYDKSMYVQGECQEGHAEEEFISCLDFVVGNPQPTPPTPPPPTPPPIQCGSWTDACSSCKSPKKCVPCATDPSKWQCSDSE